jgi:hypothetical protein
MYVMCLALIIPHAAGAQAPQAHDKVVDGVLLTHLGALMSSTPIGLYVEDLSRSATGTIPLDYIGEDTTDGLGNFQINDELPGGSEKYRNKDDTVNLVLMSSSADHILIQNIVAYPPTEDEGWQWLPDPQLIGEFFTPEYGPTEFTSDAVDDLTSIRAVALPADTDSDDGTNTDFTVTPYLQSPEAASSSGCPNGWYTQWRKTDVSQKTYETAQRAYTLSKSTVDYEWENTTRTAMSLVVGSGTTGQKGGLGYSRVQTYGTGVKPHFPNNTSQTLRVEWRYYKCELWCYGGLGWVRSSHWQWRPENFTGGHVKTNNSNVFSCNTAYRVTISSPLWVARSTSVTWSASGAIAGVSIDNQQQNSSSHKLTFTPNNHKNGGTARICGRNADPVLASQVKEVS